MEAAPEFIRMTPGCGALVRGMDLARPLDNATTELLTNALAEYGVLFFRDQELTYEQHKSLGRCFGELHLHPAWPRLVDGHPEIMELFTDENSERIAGEDWHSDVTCDREPPLGTILRMIEVPSVGGDTLFANMYAAFETLSSSMQKRRKRTGRILNLSIRWSARTRSAVAKPYLLIASSQRALWN